MGRENGLSHGDVRGDESSKSGWRDPDTAFSSAKKGERSSHSDSPCRAGARETDSSENVSVTMMEKTSLSTWQEDVTGSGTSMLERGFRNMWLCTGGGWKTKRKGALL